MANLKDLIVTGASRFLGKIFGTSTNADIAEKASKDGSGNIITETYAKKEILYTATTPTTITIDSTCDAMILIATETRDDFYYYINIPIQESGDIIIKIAGNTDAVNSSYDVAINYRFINSDGETVLNFGDNGNYNIIRVSFENSTGYYQQYSSRGNYAKRISNS